MFWLAEAVAVLYPTFIARRCPLALMESAGNDLISHGGLHAHGRHQVCVSTVRPGLPSHVTLALRNSCVQRRIVSIYTAGRSLTNSRS